MTPVRGAQVAEDARHVLLVRAPPAARAAPGRPAPRDRPRPRGAIPRARSRRRPGSGRRRCPAALPAGSRASARRAPATRSPRRRRWPGRSPAAPGPRPRARPRPPRAVAPAGRRGGRCRTPARRGAAWFHSRPAPAGSDWAQPEARDDAAVRLQLDVDARAARPPPPTRRSRPPGPPGSADPAPRSDRPSRRCRRHAPLRYSRNPARSAAAPIRRSRWVKTIGAFW